VIARGDVLVNEDSKVVLEREEESNGKREAHTKGGGFLGKRPRKGRARKGGTTSRLRIRAAVRWWIFREKVSCHYTGKELEEGSAMFDGSGGGACSTN